jgi:hypothetical protein
MKKTQQKSQFWDGTKDAVWTQTSSWYTNLCRTLEFLMEHKDQNKIVVEH